MDVVERFLEYISISTEAIRSSSGKTPSCLGQLTLADRLVEELIAMGMSEVRQCKNGTVYAMRPALNAPDALRVGFIAHLDTYPMGRVGPIHPLIIPNFQGEISLKDMHKQFPDPVVLEMKKHLNEELIISKGSTLLGVDNKAGIAEIMTAMERICGGEGDCLGEIHVVFVPDEEIGKGCALLDTTLFTCDIAYVVDGEELGDIHTANMSAYLACMRIKGENSFLGHAKERLKNAIDIAVEFMDGFPPQERPQYSDGEEGFYHFGSIEGDVSSVILTVTIMEFEPAAMQKKINTMYEVCKQINQKYGKGTIKIFEVGEGYNNIATDMNENPLAVILTEEAFAECGIQSRRIRFRGCTDASIVNNMGILATTIGVGGGGFHSIYEWVSTSSMRITVDALVNLCHRVADGQRSSSL